jgi:predicted ATPase
MGLILYELFSGEKMPLMEDVPTSNATSVEHIDLTADTESNDDNYRRPHKKSQQQATHTGDMVSDCMALLERNGLPWSVCNLVKNLMDCGKGGCCGDDAYTSFAELKQDLSVMVGDPSKFIDNIQMSSSLPTLEICDKLYGREEEMAKLDGLYHQYIKENAFRGVIISGGAGVGKSRLAMYTQELTNQCGGYFCASKFEQNQMNAAPLATIGAVFNTLCNSYAEEATSNQLKMVEEELQTRLGSQAGLLAGVVPSIKKLLPSCVQAESSSNCMDAALSMRYLLSELLQVISVHSSCPITLLMDDIQFADLASLFLIGQLLCSAKGDSLSVFIVFSHRDDKDSQTETFDGWLDSISMFEMEIIKLGNMSAKSVNDLVSETLHIIPRITRPLSDVLYQKSRGNPLFLRQLVGSMNGQGLIYVNLNQRRWAWDLKKIEQEPISPSVLSLLIKEMQQLDTSLQLGLGVASCFGSHIGKDMLSILSQGLEVDLVDILEKVSQKGFMHREDNGVMFHFAHDKIQEAGTSTVIKYNRVYALYPSLYCVSLIFVLFLMNHLITHSVWVGDDRAAT